MALSVKTRAPLLSEAVKLKENRLSLPSASRRNVESDRVLRMEAHLG